MFGKECTIMYYINISSFDITIFLMDSFFCGLLQLFIVKRSNLRG